ncbi:MAG: hypothetical protein JWO13_2277 [Acidobacteriales bacterium]|nr:hypothetical protein [Terriglobales bacterium]
MTFPGTHNVGARLSAKVAGIARLVAAGTGDNTAVVGQILDRTLFGYALSAVFGILCRAVLGANATLTLKNIALFHGDAANMSDEASFATIADTVVLTDSGAGSTLLSELLANVDLAGCKRYVRLKYTPDLSAANTDTAEVAGVIIFGGKDTI